MNIKLPIEQHLEFLSFKGGCTGWFESTFVKMPHCWKSRHGSNGYNNSLFLYNVPVVMEIKVHSRWESSCVITQITAKLEWLLLLLIFRPSGYWNHSLVITQNTAKLVWLHLLFMFRPSGYWNHNLVMPQTPAKLDRCLFMPIYRTSGIGNQPHKIEMISLCVYG